MYFTALGKVKAPVYRVDSLKPGHVVEGPALFIDKISTIVVEPDCSATITAERNILISVAPETAKQEITTKLEPIQLAIFMHR